MNFDKKKIFSAAYEPTVPYMIIIKVSISIQQLFYYLT